MRMWTSGNWKRHCIVALLAVWACGVAWGAWEWEWLGDAKMRTKMARRALDAKTPEAVAFLVTGFDDTDEGVAIRCMDYVIRLVGVQGVQADREALCAAVIERIPARSYKLTEKACDVLAAVGPCEGAREHLRDVLVQDNVEVSRIVLRAMLGLAGYRDIMANVKDVFDRRDERALGDAGSLDAIAEAADKFAADKSFQLLAIRAIGILGEEEDCERLAEILNDKRARAPSGKYEVDRVVYALRGAVRFEGGRELIEQHLMNLDRKVVKEAKKCLERWGEQHLHKR